MRADRDLVAAVSTPPGNGGIGIVRITGKDPAPLAEKLTGKHLPEPRKAELRRFLDQNGQLIDQGIVLFFAAPDSFTGQDVLELHCHGGLAVTQSLIGRCLELGARAANPGEFTLRAYLNGKLDLAQAEAVADLIGASTESAARAAARTLQGAFSDEVRAMERELVEVRSLIEAHLDFPDEDLPPEAESGIRERIEALARGLDNLLGKSRQGVLMHQGIRIALIGPPNVGKSSLINLLSREDAAIVTDTPGTTRDPVRRMVSIRGISVELTDTAGIRATTDPVEAEGISRSRQAAELADIAVAIYDPDSASKQDRMAGLDPDIVIHNKIDLSGAKPHRKGSEVWMSVKFGQGIDLFEAAVLEKAGYVETRSAFMARPRQMNAISRAYSHSEAALGEMKSLEIAAERLREAHDALGGITGRMTADELLGEIFSRFCIGK